MKSSQSLFQTRPHIKFRQAHHQHTYQVLKLNQHASNDRKNFIEPVNIFRDSSNPLQKQQIKRQYFRPVGGKQLFKKMDQNCKDRSNDRKGTKRKTNRDQTQSSHVSRVRRQPSDMTQNLPLQSLFQNREARKNTQKPSEEIFKSHTTYDPYSSASKTPKSTLTPKFFTKSQNLFRPVTSVGDKHQKWTAEQRIEYQEKNAFLKEISFNQPLNQVYGDRYFEFLLRNRFEDDIKPSPYVYVVNNKPHESRAITKLKHYRPDIKKKQMIVVRGQKLRTDVETRDASNFV